VLVQTERKCSNKKAIYIVYCIVTVYWYVYSEYPFWFVLLTNEGYHFGGRGGNRTHHGNDYITVNGFEVREIHQNPSTPDLYILLES
jgi:hypothetical protein